MASSNNRWGHIFRVAFPHSIPVLTGYLALGFAFGVLLQDKGYNPAWALLFSAVCFCGSMQYVALTLLTVAFHPFNAFLLSLMVNARHLFYGLSLLKKYEGAGKLKFFLIYFLSDETYSICATTDVPEGMDGPKFYFAISLLDYCYWSIGSVLGAITGDLLTFNSTGMDFVLTSLFVVLLINQLRDKSSSLSAIIGLVCTLVALAVFGSGNMVIPAMVLILIALLIGRKKLCA